MKQEFNLSEKRYAGCLDGMDEMEDLFRGEDVREFIRRLKEEINDIEKINVENSHKSGVSEPLRKQIMELIVGSFIELEDRIDKLAGADLI